MSGVRDITPAEPLWPKRRIEKVRRDDEQRPPPEERRPPPPHEGDEQPGEERPGTDHPGTDRIDEYA